MTYIDIIREFNDRFLAHGSWLPYAKNLNFGFATFFDPDSIEYNEMGSQQKLLILRELLFCGIGPDILYSYFTLYNQDDDYGGKGFNLGKILLKLLDDVSSEDISLIDNHNPIHWNRKDEVPLAYKESVHGAILWVLGGMHEDFHSELKKERSILVRKRLVFSHRVNASANIRIVPNYNPILDQVDDELLSRVDTMEPDVKLRVNTIPLLAADIHDELDPENKEKRIALAELIYKAVEALDLETLKTLSFYEKSNIEHFVDIKVKPKEWLYNQVYDLPLKRTLAEIRGVEFHW